jgi:hypothetical protein
LETSQGEDDGALILAQDLYRREHDREHDEKSGQDQNRDDIDKHNVAPFRPR